MLSLFLACVMKYGRSHFPFVQVRPTLRHVIWIIQRDRDPRVVPVI